MQNRYPGKCAGCRAAVAVGQGSYTNGRVMCAKCEPVQAPAPVVPATPRVRVGRLRDGVSFTPAAFLGGELFAKYRTACAGAIYVPEHRTNVAPLEKATGVVAALTAAGFLVDVPPEIVGALQAVRSMQQGLIINADERASEVDAKLRERGLVLFAFQRFGIKWLASRMGALLADEMGLGKTIQAIVAFPSASPILVICPAVAKGVWAREIARWRPDLRTTILSGRGSLTRWPEAGEVVITNYDILPEPPVDKMDAVPLAPWSGAMPRNLVLVGDEAHAIKSSKAKRTIAFRAIAKRAFDAGGGRVWLITGTPLLNKPNELWNVLQAADIAREAFGSWDGFVSEFGGSPGEYGGIEWGTPSDRVKDKIKRVCLRRLRVDVLPELPVKTWQHVPVAINKTVRLALDKTTKQLTTILPTAWEKILSDDDPFESKPSGDTELARAIVEARQWMSLTASTNFEAMSTGRALLAKAKIPSLIEMVENFEENEEPLVVFSAYRAPIDIFAERPGWAVITGDTPPAERTKIEDAFQAGKLKGVAGTIKAMGVAITLTHAHHAIFVDREFTPGLNDQAEDRVCRIGQTRGCIIHDLVADHPLDKLLYEILGKKEMIIAKSVNAAKRVNEDPVELPEVDFQALTAAALEEARIAEEAARLIAAQRAEIESVRAIYEAELTLAKREGRIIAASFLTPGRRGPTNPRETWAMRAIIALNQLDPDRAGVHNDVGWNGSDTHFGHRLGERLFEGLTDKEWEAGAAMSTKYWRQVGRPPEPT